MISRDPARLRQTTRPPTAQSLPWCFFGYRTIPLLFGLVLICQPCWARSWRPGQLPNGSAFFCANCHIDPGGGGPRNPFGQAVEAELIRLYGSAVGEQGGFWSPGLATVDSDGDGYTNGEELGDPAGTWTQGSPNPPGPATNPGSTASHPVNAVPSITITSPAPGAVFTIPANVVIQAVANDTDGTVVRVEFYDNAAPVAASSVSPYSATVLLTSPGQHSLTAVATDNRGARTTSSPVTVLAQPPGTPPTVQITSPTNGAAFTNTPVTLLLQASAVDNDGSVTNVEFFDGPISIGSASTNPYAINATLAYGGSHLLTAVASDDAGWSSTSAVVAITIEGGRLWNVDVTDSAYSPSTVTIKAGDTVRWTVRGALNHTITSTSGLFPSANLTNGDGSTYQRTFARAGSYAYYCAYHTSGTIGTQRGMVNVEPLAAPLVSLLEPTNNASFTTHDTIALRASATDPNGVVEKVEFFDSNALLGVVTNEPYTLSVTLGPGTHTLTARATDSENGVSASSPITIIVSTVPIANPILNRIAKGEITVELRTVADSLTSPLGMAVPDDGSGRMFVYDQAGIVWLMSSNGVSPEPALIVSNRLVALGSYDERGLLGLATHPEFAQNPLIYTYTSESNSAPADFTSSATNHNHQSVIAEWRVDPSNSNRVDASSRREILRIDKPQSNHNGGTLRFGPDGYLYIAIGDGGRADDQGDGHLPGGNAQNTAVVYGKLLRIDVDGRDSLNGQYAIPADNPYYGWGLVDEIFAYGLRNPFSFSFDRATGDLYLGDVGQNKVEEINLIVNGGNYGWRIKEGAFFFDPNGTNAGYVTDTPVVTVPVDLVEPIAQYDHDDGSAIIGGFVYRGSGLPVLTGRYVFGDWGFFDAPTGRLFYLDTNNVIKELRIGLDDRALGHWIKGFGEDASGELYVMASTTLGPSGATGKVFRIVAPEDLMRIISVSANPANTTLTFSWTAVVGNLYQVQFKSDLNQASWTDLGSVITATNSTMSSSDNIGPDNQRVYRVVKLP